MTPEQLKALVDQDEGQLLERKESAARDPVLQTLVGFANRTPLETEAVLLIGQRKNKEVLGVDGTEALQPKIRGWAANDCYPPIDVEFGIVPGVAGPKGPLLAVVVKGSRLAPHFTGHSYVRVGSETVKASAHSSTT